MIKFHIHPENAKNVPENHRQYSLNTTTKFGISVISDIS